jgi:2-polyprenyl-3-methyl-5-hydroxy-6-metoxy-1,4-benzoquinol methylase
VTPSVRDRKREWDDLARVDPFWGVVTMPDQRGGGDREAFFASGEQLIARMLDVAVELGLPAERSLAIDFGCGLGRLTRPLAKRFRTVHGVDASGQLIEQAQQLNRDLENCTFTQLAGSDLAAHDRSADLVCAMLVLQHQARRAAIRSSIAEFVRIVGADGLVVFQLPTEIPWRSRLQPRRRLYSLLRRAGVPPATLYHRLRLDPIRMLHLTSDDVAATVERAGGTILRVDEDNLAGKFPSATYYVGRRGG